MADTVTVKIPRKDGAWPPFSAHYRGRWYLGGHPMVEKRDCLPCAKCGCTDVDVCANVVSCMGDNCDHDGPSQPGPEFMCDWREAIIDWNNDPLRNLPEPWSLDKLEPFPSEATHD